jgi:fermentation-respiration switch protein FrsA (DUF1100 family)
MWKRALFFAIFLLLSLLVLTPVWLSYQGAYDYLHPQRLRLSPQDNPGRYGIPYQDVTLTTSDNLKLQAWYTPPQNGAIILLAHGYKAARLTDFHLFLAQHGYGVLSWDARAHGESEGDLCTWGYYEVLDVAAALAYAQQQHPAAIGILGLSMGGVTAIRAAVQYPAIEAVVADSAFAGIIEPIHNAIPSPIMRPLIRFFVERELGLTVDDLRPVDEIGQIAPRPVFILQGLSDTLVPPDNAEKLYSAAGEPRYLWTEPGVGHVGLYGSRPDEYAQRVTQFFDTYLLQP